MNIESDEDKSNEKSYKYSFINSNKNEYESAKYQNSDNTVNVKKNKNIIEIRSNLYAIYRNIIKVDLI